MKRPEFIRHYRDFMSTEGGSYPGSNERLAHFSPVGRKLGLKAIGVNIVSMPPGTRSSWPHAESHEEEFVFVIEGTPQAWIDGHVHDLVPGDFVAFPPGTGIAHTFLNNTEDEVLLLVGGEDFDHNKIVYPLHPARNAQCREEGWGWEDAPERPLGDHDGMPDRLRESPVDPPQ